MKLALAIFCSLLASAHASPFLAPSKTSTARPPAASATWTNTCGSPCDDLCTCDEMGRINCHGSPWMCYESCCKYE